MRHVLPALAILLVSGWLLHPVLPHEGAHEALAAALASVTMHRGDTLAVVGDDCTPQAQKVKNQPRINLRCAGPTVGPGTPTLTPRPTTAAAATATPVVIVVTPTVGATTQATRTPTATSAALPTATAIPPTQTPAVVVQTPTAVTAAMHEGVPICADHDRTMWHALVERDAAGVIACTYGHEHHDDPNAVNDIFGEPGAWYGGTQEISYVWETVGAAGPENVAKHEGYKWFVYRDLPCVPASNRSENEGCMRAFRIQAHALGTVADAVVRMHSYSIEVLLDYKGQQGIARYGGHVDIGHLALFTKTGFVCPALESNPAMFTCGNGHQRRHSSVNAEPEHQSHAAFTAGWYGDAMTTFIEEWGPINVDNPGEQMYFRADQNGPNQNNSRGRIENLGVEARFGWLKPYTTGPFALGGTVSFKGYRDRGASPSNGPSTTCTSPSISCWPIAFESVPWGAYFLQANMIPEAAVQHEHDVKSPVTGGNLIRFPN